MANSRGLSAFARFVIRTLVPRSLREEVEGDLAERSAEVERAEGRGAARRWLRWQLVSLRPWALRRHGIGRGPRRGGGWVWDVRLAFRALRLRPGSSLIVVLTVGLAVGATTSVYSVVDGILLQPLPYPDSDRLVRVWQTKESWFDSPNSQLRAFANRFPLSGPTFNDWTEANTGFQALGAYSGRSYVHQGLDGAEVLRGQVVTSGFFVALRVQPLIGRYLLPEDDGIGAERVVVLSEGLWEDRFGRSDDALGASLSLDGTAHVVVGVMPSGFQGPEGGAALWAPLDEEDKADARDSQFLSVVGRLADGVTLEAAAQRVATVQAGLAEAYPDEHGDLGSRMEGLLDSVVGDVRATLWFLLGAVGLVLLVATLNVANVLAVVGLTRRRELAVKAALGAGAGRLMRGLFIESALLATMGGVVGIGLAWFSLPLLLKLVPLSVPRYEMIALSPEVLLFGVLLTAVTTLAVGTLPASQAATTQPGETMRSSARATTTGRTGGRIRSAMVAAEVALAFVLLVAAGLLGNSFARLWWVDRGFATEGLVLIRATPNPMDYPEREDRDRFVRDLRASFDAIPGVDASATNQVPLSGSMSTTTYRAEKAGEEPEEVNVVINVGLVNYLALQQNLWVTWGWGRSPRV